MEVFYFFGFHPWLRALSSSFIHRHAPRPLLCPRLRPRYGSIFCSALGYSVAHPFIFLYSHTRPPSFAHPQEQLRREKASRNDANERVAQLTKDMERIKLQGDVARAGGKADMQGLLTSRSNELEVANAKVVKLSDQVRTARV